MDDSRSPTPLYLPASLLPITIHRLLAPHSHSINKTQPLFSYSYYESVQQQQQPRHDNNSDTRQRVVKVWDSPVQGTVVKWAVKEGQQVTTPG